MLFPRCAGRGSESGGTSPYLNVAHGVSSSVGIEIRLHTIKAEIVVPLCRRSTGFGQFFGSPGDQGF
jgi:hypothetical protein